MRGSRPSSGAGSAPTSATSGSTPTRHAAASAFRLGAAAYTDGSGIVFAPHEYQPHTSTGRLLLAHELAHVVQLRGTAVGNRVGSVSRPGDDHELDADRAAHAAQAGTAVLAPRPAMPRRRRPVLRDVKADPFDALRAATPVTGPQAEAMIRHYGTLDAAGRDAVVRAFARVGFADSPLRRWLAAIPVGLVAWPSGAVVGHRRAGPAPRGGADVGQDPGAARGGSGCVPASGGREGRP